MTTVVEAIQANGDAIAHGNGVCRKGADTAPAQRNLDHQPAEFEIARQSDYHALLNGKALVVANDE